MEKSERVFLWLLAIGLAALVFFEMRGRGTASTDIEPKETGVSGEGISIAPRGPVGAAYLIYNQPGYNPGPPQFNVMPGMAKAPALDKGGCFSCH